METRKNIIPTENSSSSSRLIPRRNSSPLKKCLKFDDEPRRKRRRKKCLNKNEKMRNIIIDIEKEIEEQLDAKTEDNDFTTSNVKGILKELIMDEDMKEMVRHSLHPGDRDNCYEPKLTRAKIRQLLEEKPDLKIPILWPIPQNNTNFVSECLSLINENYPENSSEDEEYKPDDDEIDYVDSLFQENASSHDISSTSDNSNHGINSVSSNSGSHSLKIEENIGQRTRSKLPLTETRLEDIEQTFNPPDITTDMYDFDIDNEDYLNFLRTYDSGNLELADMDDDLDDDPEYRVPADAETVDREELRQDESTEVSSVEVWNLIEEFIICNESMKTFTDRRKSTETNTSNAETDDNDSNLPVELESVELESNVSLQESDVSNQSIEHTSPVKSDAISLEKEVTELGESSNSELSRSPNITSSFKPSVLPSVQQITVTPEQQSDLSPLKKSEQSGPVLSKQQRLLFDQQLRQHVQLTTTHFLQCYKHPTLFKLAGEMKNLLTSLQLLAKSNKKSAYNACNLYDSLKLIDNWEQTMADVPDPESDFLRKQKHRARKKRYFSPNFMKMVCKSNVFMYPLLLPERPFSSVTEKTIRRKELTKSEEWLLAIGLQQFYDYAKNMNRSSGNTNITQEALKLTIHYLLPNYKPKFLLNVITKKETDDPDNSSIKYYLVHKKAPPLKHFVIPVSPFPLFKQPYDLLPKIWQEYISRNFVVLKQR